MEKMSWGMSLDWGLSEDKEPLGCQIRGGAVGAVKARGAGRMLEMDSGHM